MKKTRIDRDLKKSQFLIAGLFSLFLFIILEIVGVLFYFGIPKIEEYFFEKELNIIAQEYEQKINQKSISESKDIKRIKIGDYIVLLDKEDKSNFLVQKGGKDLGANLKKIVLKNKFTAIDTDSKNEFSNKYFFSKSNLKEKFFTKSEIIFTLDYNFFNKYYIKKNFNGIKKFSLNGRKVFVYNKTIFLNSIGKEFFYQAIIPSNIPDKALNTFIFYFEMIILLISILSFFIYYFISRKILEPIKISNEKIKKFSDNVGHEIMSPVTVISGIAQLAEIKSENMKDDVKIKKDSIKKILKSTDKIQNIVETLKKISLLERKNFELEEKNLGKILKVFLSNKKDSNSILKIEKNVNKKIDESLFYLILENLYLNAEKYKLKDSQVKIFLTKNKIVFENQIENKIPESDLKRLKEKFFQADNSRRSKGSGLGLSIIDECLKILGWKINFSSEEKIFKAEINF